jgi:hypothetical protein
MRTLRKNWSKLAGAVACGILAVCAVYACVSAWGQTAPGLTITPTGSSEVLISITNGVSNGLYQIYYREDLTTNSQWFYFTNGIAGQTNFRASMGDTIMGFFEAAYNPSFVTPTITVIIQSPTNGAVVY